MTRINGNDGMNNNFFLKLNPLHTSKTDKPVETEQTTNASETTPINFDFGVGSKQNAAQIRGMEVEGVTKLSEADQNDLNSLAQMAGIKRISVSQDVYNRIDNSVKGFTSSMNELTVGNNAEDLFKSVEFQTLNNIFGIV